MKAGNFSINDYLDKLYENSESGNISSSDKEGLIIPDENKKSFDWLKKEYNKSQTTVKVEISGSGASFKPGYDIQASNDSSKAFKPGAFGNSQSSDNTDNDGDVDDKSKKDDKSNLDPKKDSPSFKKGEGDEKKKESPKTFTSNDNIKNTKDDKKETLKKENPEVKKIDLKTKKNDKE